MAGGRRRVLDDAKQREICALISAGCGIDRAAQYIGCAANTIRRESLRNPDFDDRLREARATAQLRPLQAMQQAAATHWRAAAWMLERTDPEQFARRAPHAFRPKQAQALLREVLEIVASEVDDRIQCERLQRRIRTVMKYAMHDVRDTRRSGPNLREAMKYLDAIDRDNNEHDDDFYAQFGGKNPFAPPSSLNPMPAQGPRSSPGPRSAQGPRSTEGPVESELADEPGQPDAIDRYASQADLAGILRTVCKTYRATPPADGPNVLDETAAATKPAKAQTP